MNIVIPVSLKTLAQQFLAAGSKLYIVGGYVRNAVMGDFPTDIDITSNVAPERLRTILHNAKVTPVNKTLGTCIIAAGNQKYDYTPYRSETYAEGGAHRPLSVLFTNSMAEDSRRRDFTCNTLYYDILDNKILDPYGGVADINKKVLRAIVSPQHVFKRDGLRILRMVRQAAEMGFNVDPDTFNCARELVSQLKDISPERKRIELEKILAADQKYGVADAHYRGLKLIGELDAWQYIIPEIADGIGVIQNPKYHKSDVYEHTLLTVKYAPKEIRLAALMHDIGKPEALRQHGNMYKHPEIGAAITKERLSQTGLRYPNVTVLQICKIVRHHNYDLDGTTSLSKLRVFIAKNVSVIEDIIALKKADAMATGLVSEPVTVRIETVYDQMKAEKCPMRLSDLEINGADIFSAYPDVKKENMSKILRALLDEVVMNPSLNNKEWLIARAGKIVSFSADENSVEKS